MIEIIQKGNPILREIAKEIPVEEIASSKNKKVFQDMAKSIDENEDGLAIAAPQIGISIRAFLISKKIFTLDENGDALPEKELADMDKHKDLIFINPEIINRSRKTQWLTEGCLSVRGVYGKVKRSEKVMVRAFNEKGELFTRGASGMMAQTIQHENDHLDGILFIDKAKDLKEVNFSDDKK